MSGSPMASAADWRRSPVHPEADANGGRKQDVGAGGKAPPDGRRRPEPLVVERFRRRELTPRVYSEEDRITQDFSSETNDPLLRHLRNPTTLILAGIIACAAAAPFAAFLAAHASASASDADQARLQNLALAEEHYSQDVATTDQDVRVFGGYAELENMAIALRAQAEHAADASQRRLALALYRQAQADRSLAAGLRQGMQTSGLRPDDVNGPHFAYVSALKGEVARDAELERAQEERDVAVRAPVEASDLFLTATIWAMGVVFFTLAQIAGEQPRRRNLLATLGLVALLTAASFQLVVML